MRLTIEKDPAAVERYGHIKPARRLLGRRCAARCPGVPSRTCTLEKRHRGPHVAHGRFRKVLAVWDEGTEIRGPRESAKKMLEARARRDLQADKSLGERLAGLRSVLTRIPDSLEEIVLIVFFLGMLGFVIEWVVLIVTAR